MISQNRDEQISPQSLMKYIFWSKSWVQIGSNTIFQCVKL